MGRHMGFHGFDDIVHLLGGFTHSKTTDGVAGQVKIGDALHVINTDIGVGTTLVDTPEHLLGVYRIRQGIESGIFSLAALQPAIGSVHTLEYIVPGCRIFDALVKGHADIRAQIGLDLHTLLRAHKDLTSVDVG